MTGTVFLVILVALPPILLVAAHVYATYAQDNRVGVVVLVDSPTDIEVVAEDHRQRFKADIAQQWNSDSNHGYRGTVPVRQLANLRTDPHVLSVDRTDD